MPTTAPHSHATSRRTPPPDTARSEPAAHLSNRATAMRSSEIRDLLRLTQRPDIISLAGGLPDPESFPSDEMADVAARLVRDQPFRTLQYGPTEGDPTLREAVAARHHAATGRPTSADQVLITTGSQQGLDLLGRVLGDPGDLVMVEDPAYLGALQAFRANGLRLRGIPVDHDGIDVDQLAALLDDTVETNADHPAFLYTVPTFQNPTGATLSDDRRLELAALSERHDLLVIEDTPYADLPFRGETIPPLAARSETVITLGTVSKTLAPGLRVGWMVGPTWLIAAATKAKQAVDLHTSSLTQAIVAELLADQTWFDRQIAAVTSRYRDRATALCDALHERLGDRVHCTRPEGGMFVWAQAPGIDTRRLLELAVEEGTAFVPGAAFSVDADRSDCLRLSFATTDAAGLVEAVHRLARAIDRFDAS